MIHDIKQYSEDEIKKIRQEILDWIERNEKKIDGSFNDKMIERTSAVKSYEVEKSMEAKKTVKSENSIGKKIQKNFFHFLKFVIEAAINKITLAIAAIFILAIVTFTFINFNNMFSPSAMEIDSKRISLEAFKADQAGIQYVTSAHLAGEWWFERNLNASENTVRYEILHYLSKKYAITSNDAEIKKIADEVMVKNANAKNVEILKKYLAAPQIWHDALLQMYRDKDGKWTSIKKAADIFSDNIMNKNIPYADAREILGKGNVVIEKDLGFITKNESEYSFDNSVFGLAINAVSQKYEEDDGIHFYRVEDAIREMDVIRVRDIIILSSIDFEKAFREEMKSLKIRIYKK